MRGGAALGLVLAFCASPAAAQPQATPLGLWLTQDRDGVVEIMPCGSALCGRLVGVSGFGPDGRVKPAWDGRSLCGHPLIADEVETRPGRWTGRITDPRDGATYDAALWLDEQGRLRLRGYVALPLFGSTQIWTRYRGRVTPDCHIVPGPG